MAERGTVGAVFQAYMVQVKWELVQCGGDG